MAGYKETPRQKMIAMMYLVLTALLALNVSVEIINAFVVVNKSMETSNQNLKVKVDQMYSSFENQANKEPAKFGPFWDRASQARNLSDNLIRYIDSLKFEAIARTEKISFAEAQTKALADIQAKDKYDATTAFFIGNSHDGAGGEAAVLKKKIEDYKASITNLLDPADREALQVSLDTKGPFKDANGKEQNWEMHNFYHTILAANVTFLNKLIADVRNVENDVVSKLYSNVSEEDFKFESVVAKVIPNTRLLFAGETYESEIMVAAIDSKSRPEVVIGGRTYTAGPDGTVKFSTPAGGVGSHSYSGVINVKGPSGDIKSYPFEENYFVMSPALAVAATKMNVFYANVDNPVSISASGIPESQISASISTGSIRRAGSGWVVRVPGGQNATITVNHNSPGGSKRMGTAVFRVKRLPAPTAYIANTDGGNVAKNVLVASRAIIPRMPEDFDFDLNYTISSFNFSAVRSGDVFKLPGRGNVLSPEMIRYIEGARRGEKIFFEDIIANGPDGNRKLNSIVITVQ